IANRNALIAAAFGFAALLLHDIGAQREAESKRAAPYPYATALALALALGAGESGVATIVYLGAHALLLDRRPVGARVRSLPPAAAVTMAWAAAYRAGRFGATGAGMSPDPIRAPLAFVRGLASHPPILLASELGVSPDAWPNLSIKAKIVILCAATLL